MKKTYIVFLSILFEVSQCRDFYVGMFKKNDFLVAQDTVYKERSAFGYTTAKYGRVFHCPITYFRVSDRLGYGKSPNVIVTRGGLQKKYITLRITSPYNTPIAVNVYVGCENNLPPKPKSPQNKTGKANIDNEHSNEEEQDAKASGEDQDDQASADAVSDEQQNEDAPADAPSQEEAPADEPPQDEAPADAPE